VCARVFACAIERPRIRPDTCACVRSASTAGGFGSQAFSSSAFNADIGAWNTASVTTLSSVPAAFGPAARHRVQRVRRIAAVQVTSFVV
jgi:surface protein